MSDPAPDRDAPPGQWAPQDLTDNRNSGDWKTLYPAEARKGIFWESIYLAVVFAVCLSAVFYVVYAASAPTEQSGQPGAGGQPSVLFLGYVGAWVAGCLGGCTFDIKWLYHCVAKQLWHEDRRLWRLLTPHLSGVVSLFMVFLVSSGLLQIFDKDFAQRPIGVMAFSFLVGYFSDKALAKMADVADTLFGPAKEEHESRPPRDGRR